MCLPYTIEKLRETVQSLAVSNEKLDKTRETLMQAEKLASMGQLAAGIAHELNNPLGVVLMYAHILEEQEGKDVAISGDLKMIMEQAERCKHIVSGLLHFARQNKVTKKSTDLRTLVESSLRAVLIPSQVHVETVHELSDFMADFDIDQMVQVLDNLICNACDAMPDGGVLTIRTSGNDMRVEIHVHDTGPGIPKEHMDKIFEPFFTTKGIGKGTGLGLAIAYGIIKMHSGDIRITSNGAESGTGTEFTVSLPRHGMT
jgi:signal transduction histidine kinase